jgi:thioredoxin reductase (NADPH)
MSIHSVIIIGSGPAGCSAGVYAGRAGLKPIIITGQQEGGQLVTTTEVENFLGFKEINGYELTVKFKEHAESCGAKFIDDFVVNVRLEDSNIFTVTTNKNTYLTKTIIVATGSTAKKLTCDGADRLWMNGISACAVCDGALKCFRNKHLIVIGGGDTAMEEALYLTAYASLVTIVHRKDIFRASKVMQDKVFENVKNKKIQIVWNSEILIINGEKRVESVTIKNVKTGDVTIVKCEGIFYGIGSTPNVSFLKDSGIEMLETGHLKTIKGTHTSINGIFACGDVQDVKYKQAITAAGSGCQAALDVVEYLS